MEWAGQMAGRLSTVPRELALLGTSQERLRAVTRLLDLTDWLSETDGYGNFLLALRANDLAASGLGPLVADVTFPLAELEPALKRLPPAWIGLAGRERMLNREVGAPLFNETNAQNLAQAFAQGWVAFQYLSTDKPRKPILSRVVNGPPIPIAILDHWQFFAPEETGGLIPFTTTTRLNGNYFHWSGMASIIRSVDQVITLADFRRAVGGFPEARVYSAEERARLDKEIADYAARGIKVVPIESAYSSPREAAFYQAWEATLEKPTKANNEEYNRKLNRAAAAWGAFKMISEGAPLDSDSQAEAWAEMNRVR
ncbi:MAG TPA: hypothetical protein VHD32_07890 [Candidatus Didemnitutus sp.]|nr:hypothetical protein [Candidatus Didemnitutus sp.]